MWNSVDRLYVRLSDVHPFDNLNVFDDHLLNQEWDSW
jgi:hypothetical protein